MSPLDEKGKSYIEVARQELTQYAQGLLRENEKLRAGAAMLESETRRLEQERETFVGELDRLRMKFHEVEQENQKYGQQYQQIELHSNNLSNLYVASYQLHSSVDRETILNAIQEIVINLIGSEEVAIFEAHPGSMEFRLASSFGVDAQRLPSFKLGDGPVGQRLATGEVFVDDFAAGGQNKLTACVPLKIGESIIGAILVFRLLPHKTALQPVDHELFELLAIHASTALYCASLHARATLAVM